MDKRVTEAMDTLQRFIDDPERLERTPPGALPHCWARDLIANINRLYKDGGTFTESEMAQATQDLVSSGGFARSAGTILNRIEAASTEEAKRLEASGSSREGRCSAQ